MKWKEIQSLVGAQTHAWKLLMIVLIDPLDIKVHVRKYVAGQTNNNVIEIALKCDFGDLEDTNALQVVEAQSPGDGFDSDLDQQGLTTIMTRSNPRSPPPMEVVPLHQSTTLNEEVVAPIVAPVAVAVDSGPSSSPTKHKNPKKKLKLEVDRDIARALAQSLNSFASLLKINGDSSGDSFEVVSDEE